MSTPPNVTGALHGLTVAVTGASGNLGTALLRRLRGSGVARVRGLSRRPPPATAPYGGVEWYLTDLSGSDSEAVLADFLAGVDAVVHLAWALQPARDPDLLRRVNIDGTRRVMDAAVAAGVPHVVHMSSLGAYSPARPGRRVTEDWSASGLPSAQYSRDKVAAERVVRDVFGRRPAATLTVVRPTLVLQPEAASEIGRYFLGPLGLAAARLTPGALARRLPLPLPGLHLAFVHADDVADALARILDRRAGGAFNLAAEPLLDAAGLARALGTRRVPMPVRVLRAALQAAFTVRLVPTEPGWLDIATRIPALDSTRARTLLDWVPAHRGDTVLGEFVAALGRGDGAPGPLLRPAGGRSPAPAGSPASHDQLGSR